uniref:Uncharacterized protein n=1 Tax=Myotis myotis TaxID=51298 RepID=A0A7J8ALG7_MYOMY|nr:hypothetical protein mMyoMyo1_007831 [Myotis myotis]
MPRNALSRKVNSQSHSASSHRNSIHQSLIKSPDAELCLPQTQCRTWTDSWGEGGLPSGSCSCSKAGVKLWGEPGGLNAAAVITKSLDFPQRATHFRQQGGLPRGLLSGVSRGVLVPSGGLACRVSSYSVGLYRKSQEVPLCPPTASPAAPHSSSGAPSMGPGSSGFVNR